VVKEKIKGKIAGCLKLRKNHLSSKNISTYNVVFGKRDKRFLAAQLDKGIRCCWG
jgi:hypothetical protein